MQGNSVQRWKRIGVLVGIVGSCLLGQMGGQGQVPKQPIPYSAYNGWRSIQGSQLARNGEWVAYALVPQDGDGELVVRSLKTNVEYRQPRGIAPRITADSGYVVFRIAPLKADTDRAKKEKKKPEEMPKSGLGILDLSDGSVQKVENVRSFEVPEEGGDACAYLLEPKPKMVETKSAAPGSGTNPALSAPATATPPATTTIPTSAPPAKVEKPATNPATTGKSEAAKPEKKKEPGSDLVVYAFKSHRRTVLPEVVSYLWNRPGTCLAYAVSSPTPEKDGAFLYFEQGEGAGTSAILLSGRGNYRALTFDKMGGQLAFLTDRDDYASEAPLHTLYLAPSLSKATPKSTQTDKTGKGVAIVSATTPGMPKGMALTENSVPTFSDDGTKLFIGIAPKPVPPPKDAPDTINVDIWTSRDGILQPMQKVEAEKEKKRTYRAVWHIKQRRFVPLASPDMPDLAIVETKLENKNKPESAEVALGSSNLPYRMLSSWDTDYEDVYLVHLQDGTRQKILEKQRGGASLSPGGNYVLYFDHKQQAWCTRRVSDGRIANLTGKLGTRFTYEEWDTPDAPPPYPVMGWTEEDRSVILSDRYDLWEIAPDGSNAHMVTQGVGRKNHLVFRYESLDPETKTISSSQELLLSALNEETMATGFYRVSLTSAQGTQTEPACLMMLDKKFSPPQKAKNAGVLLFTLQRFQEFPDLWGSDLHLSGMTKISNANPQQAQYRWGRSELIDYIGADGKRRRAILTKPDDFDPTKKYPLMVYIYEKLSQTLHTYHPPAPGTGINFSRYASKGYVLLEPDITYDTGYPGESALRCVPAAVQTVLAQGYIDPARVAIAGHSWGGYQITYLVTHTNLFRAVEAGASVANMISAYGGIRWSTGMSRAFQYEKTQSRIGGPPWERPLQFIENSPIFSVEKVTTPYLTIHNDGDGAVPWYQGIEFFTALRRLGKEAYLFNYNGEDHGLRNRENMKHWTVHLDEFFDHYLLGAPRPAWMDNGVPYAERGKRDINALFNGK